MRTPSSPISPTTIVSNDAASTASDGTLLSMALCRPVRETGADRLTLVHTRSIIGVAPVAHRPGEREDGMERRTRSEIVMGKEALAFSVSHPTDSPGYNAAVGELTKALAEAGVLEVEQRDGIIAERSGAAVRRELMDRISEVHLPHMAHAARRAERDKPDLVRQFRLTPANDSLGARRAAASSMVDAAQTNKDVLVKHGMDESVLQDLVQTLAEYDAATQRVTDGRAAHVGASARLRALGREIVGLVRVIDGLNRVRFKNDESLLAQWISMSNVRAMPKGSSAEEPASQGSEAPAAAPSPSPSPEQGGTQTQGGTPVAGEVRPAA